MYLAELYRNNSRSELAIPLYERAIQLDPTQATGPVGLGAIRMERGEYAEAIRLWKELRSPRTPACDVAGATATLEKAVDLNPGFAAATELLARVRQARHP